MASVRVHAWQGEAAVTLAAGDLAATFLPDVGMLGVSLRHRGAELLALPQDLAGYREGHVTGLPLLAPWANRLAGRHYRVGGVAVDLQGLPLATDPNGLPIHGTMSARSGWWLDLVRADAGSAWLRARFDYGARPELLASFPFPHELTVEATVEPAALAVATTLRPTGDWSVPVSFGWHPYLRLPGSRRRDWRLRLPGRSHLLLDALGLPDGDAKAEPAEDAALGERTFDDLYALGADRRLAVADAERRLTVELGEGYPYAQVFAPPGQELVSLEPMTAPVDALGSGRYELVAPGGSFSARFSIGVEDVRR
ncbi:MAG TPA: aldose 1-epimerase [Actinomycetota bacterium]|jgi:aldose 1-epimerase